MVWKVFNRLTTISNQKQLKRRKIAQKHKFFGIKKLEESQKKRKPSETCGTSSELKLRLKNKKWQEK